MLRYYTEPVFDDEGQLSIIISAQVEMEQELKLVLK
jgi:hypothetical protein